LAERQALPTEAFVAKAKSTAFGRRWNVLIAMCIRSSFVSVETTFARFITTI
jgi:hypothetical protein